MTVIIDLLKSWSRAVTGTRVSWLAYDSAVWHATVVFFPLGPEAMLVPGFRKV